MADIGAAIKARLEAVSAVTDLVGSGAAARIYPIRLPQTPTLEAVTYQVVSAPPRPMAMGDDVQRAQKRVQVSSWGNTYAEAMALREAVRDALQRWTGTAGGVVVHHIGVENEFDVFEDDVGQGGVGAWVGHMDFLVWMTES